MSEYRKGDIVSVAGKVMEQKGNFVMLSLDGAIDPAVPAMVSKDGVTLVKPSIHVNDEVEGGFRVHADVNATLVLLQKIGSNPEDPDSWKTALRDSLRLAQTDDADADADATPPAAPQVSAPAASATETAQIRLDPPVRPPETPETAVSALDAPVPETASVDIAASAETQAAETDAAPVSRAVPETVRSSFGSITDRVSGLAGTALRATTGGRSSLADLGVVREEKNPLKPVGSELLLTEEIEDEDRN